MESQDIVISVKLNEESVDFINKHISSTSELATLFITHTPFLDAVEDKANTIQRTARVPKQSYIELKKVLKERGWTFSEYFNFIIKKKVQNGHR